MSTEAWGLVIDLFTTPEYINRSIKNKANRAKQLYGSFHGSQSLENRRHKEVKETGRARHVEGWKEMHYKNGKWFNDNASHAWKKISEEYTKSLSRSGGDEMVVDQVECLKEALGSRRSHILGVGPVLKSVTPDLFPRVNRDEEDDRWQRQEQAIAKQQEEMTVLRQDNVSLRAQVNYILKNLAGVSGQHVEEHDQENDQDDEDDDEFI